MYPIGVNTLWVFSTEEMSAEYFQLIDDSKIDDPNIKKDYIKMYHQRGGEVDNENRKIELYFGQNLQFLQVGNSYLELDIEIKKADNTSFAIADESRLVNNGLTFVFQEVQISTSYGSETAQNEYLGPVSTIMSFLTQNTGGWRPLSLFP